MRRLVVTLPQELAQGLALGASVAISGTCLTLVALQPSDDAATRLAHFDVVAETLRRTTLGRLAVGDHVNVERSARLGDELGGHLVSGHVDCVGVLAELHGSLGSTVARFRIPHDTDAWLRYAVPKGWIAIDGVSLTLVDVLADGFTIALVPETLARTTLGRHAVGDAVNVEFDATAKTIVCTLERLLPALLQSRSVPPAQPTQPEPRDDA